MQLTEQHIIDKNHKYWKECDKLALASKNLYNLALYTQRQYFFDNKKYISYVAMCHNLTDTEQFKTLPANVAQQTLRLLDKNFKSFFRLLKLKLAGKYDK